MLRTDPAPAADDARAPARTLIDRQLAMLTRLAEIGMEIAEAAGRAATSPQAADAGHQPDPGLTYARAARAVRMTIALQSRLLHDVAELNRTESRAAAARASARRERVHRLVERAIEAGRDDDDEIERLSSDAWERLADTDDGDLMDAPLAEIVAAICRDLGLSPDWAAEAFAPSAGADRSPDPPRPGAIPIDAASLRLVAQPRGSPTPLKYPNTWTSSCYPPRTGAVPDH